MQTDLTKLCQALPVSSEGSLSDQASAVLEGLTGEKEEFNLSSSTNALVAYYAPDAILNSEWYLKDGSSQAYIQYSTDRSTELDNLLSSLSTIHTNPHVVINNRTAGLLYPSIVLDGVESHIVGEPLTGYVQVIDPVAKQLMVYDAFVIDSAGDDHGVVLTVTIGSRHTPGEEAPYQIVNKGQIGIDLICTTLTNFGNANAINIPLRRTGSAPISEEHRLAAYNKNSDAQHRGVDLAVDVNLSYPEGASRAGYNTYSFISSTYLQVALKDWTLRSYYSPSVETPGSANYPNVKHIKKSGFTGY